MSDESATLQIAATEFRRSKNRFQLARLCGLPVGHQGEDSGPAPALGMALLHVDGRRYESSDLTLETVEESGAGAQCRWRVGDTSLHLTAVWQICPTTGIVSRRDTLANHGDAPVVLTRCLARVAFPPGRYECYTQASRWCHENQGDWQPLHTGCRLSHLSGRTTEGSTPYLALRAAGAERGIAFHLLPRGNWTIRVSPALEGGELPFAVVELGLADENLRRALAPGETLALPEILFQPLPEGEPHRAAPALHRYLLEHQFRSAKPEAPVVYNTWFDQFEILDVPRLRAQLAAAKDVGCEVFVIDAGWYGAGGPNWWAQAGDWREKTEAAFHGEMRAFADEVRAAGLGFGLWMEPERFGPEAPVRAAHPEWFVPVGSAARMDLNQPEAYAWLRGEIGRLVETYALAWMKIDFNFGLDADASGAELAGYTAAWHRMLDDIRAAYPGTFFEGCSSGAMRSDLETVRHFDGHFLSDSVNPVDVLRISQGAWLRLPPGRLTRWAVVRSAGQALPRYTQSLADSPATLLTPRGAIWEPAESTEADFALLAAMPGMLGFSGDLAGLAPDHRARVAEGIAFYKTWRPFIAGATAHLLTPPEPITCREGWIGFQLQKPGADTSLAFVYRLGDAGAPPPFRLRGLDPEHRYTVERGLSVSEESITLGGEELMRDGLPLQRLGVGNSRALVFVVRVSTPARESLPCLENASLRLEFEPGAGGLQAIVNKLTGERYAVRGDTFALETLAFRRAQADMRLESFTATAEALTARYTDADLTVEVVYELRPADHFFQKRLAVVFAAAGGVTHLTVSQPAFALEGLALVCYRHPDFDWVTDYVEAKHSFGLKRPEGSEPARTFFGRTGMGGFFTGLEMPYDHSQVEDGRATLGYAPSLKVKAGERLECEPMYFGVYRRSERDLRAAEWTPIPAAAVVGNDGQGGFDGAAAAPLSKEHSESGMHGAPAAAKALPLPSESAAMTAMASAILGPPRHGVMAFACGWHSQMEQESYDTDEKLEAELRSLAFLSSCGLDGVTDSHPWGGESARMAALREGDRYVPGVRQLRFLERAGELGLKVTQWPTMNNTHPWRTYGEPFRMDQPGWLRGVEGEALGGANADNFRRRQANCLACEPFYEWLERIILDDALGAGLYESWCMDGDFWGTGAFFHTTLPVTCLAENHEHLPGDANYACQRRLNQLTAEVRRRYPGAYIVMCRPPMDLGVWAQRNVDACFTLIESGTGGSNIAAGNEVRTASRIRVHHHFYPHWLDWSLLFPSYADPKHAPAWPSAHIDYLMLSALACSPNLLLYLPTKTGIPEQDMAEIRTWLDWGRANVEYLLVRHDLFDWPGKGAVDGSAHLRGDRGLIFLFNPDPVAHTAEFALTWESTGFTGASPVDIRQEYPASERHETHHPGATVRWPVPAESAVVLRMGAPK